MLTYIKKLILSSGVEPAAYENARDELAEKNRSSLLYAGSACVLLFLGMFLSTFLDSSSSTLDALRMRSRLVYFLIAVLCVLVVLAARLLLPRHRRLILPMSYLFLSILFGAAIWISTFNQPCYPSTTFCVFLVVLPILIVDRPYRVALYLLGVCVMYLLCSHACKAPELFTLDTLNCFCFFYLSVAVGVLVQNLRISEVVQRKEVERQRDLDCLTGLLTKAAFEREACAALSRGEVNALLFFDIDDFKRINDTYGHIFGDAVIRAVAACTRSSLPQDTLIGRFGGDEFVLCLAHSVGRYGAVASAQALQDAIRDQIELPGFTGSVTVSIGLCVVSGASLSYPELLDRADNAAYQAKHSGKNQCCVSE